MESEDAELTVEIDHDHLDEFLYKAFDYYNLPGMMAGVGSGKSGLQYVKTFGVKNVKTEEKLLPEDIFHMASLAKLFTGTGIMLLWEKGLLELDLPITHYLDWFQMADASSGEITVRQLLTHTSGMPDVSDYHWDQPQKGLDDLRNYIRSGDIRDARLLWSPAEKKFSYSNIGYDLLGLMIAEVSGIPFEEFMRLNVFEPFGMLDSTFLTFERDEAGLCSPHRKNKDKKIEVIEHYPYNRIHAPSSTLTSNIYDMEKWAAAHLNQRVLLPETYRVAWDEFAVVPNNGEKICLSWFSRAQNGYKLYGHEGADDGFRSSFWICPELDLFIMISSNISSAPLKKISKRIFELITCNIKTY
jgi:CubicO group peptidase (beta-lactamase class C family)